MKDSFEECLKSEQDVRDQVKEKWSTFSAADKKHCVALAKTGGESSYTELLTCLEMSRDVRALRQAAAAPSTNTAKEPVSPPPTPTMRPAAGEKASSLPPLQEPPDRMRPALAGKDPLTAPTGKEPQAPVAKEAAITDQIKKDAEQAKSDAQAAKASEAIAQRKLADAEAALQRAKEEARRMTAEAERSKADAKAARDAEEALKRKLSDAEAARVAAEGREQACQTAAKAPTGIRARLRSWFGPKESNPKNP
jgi:colicin import membrane protein